MTIDLSNEELYLIYDLFQGFKEDGSFITPELQEFENNLEAKLKASWVDRGFYNDKTVAKEYSHILDEQNRRYH